MIIEIILIFIFYSLIIVIGSYYVNLYLTKDQYTKEDLKDVFPYLSQFWKKISSNYSILTFCLILFISSFLGIVIPMLSDHWFLNSSILFAVIFFIFPFAIKYFEKAQVTASNDYSDTVVNRFIKYHNIILIGFGAGTGTAIIYNWGALKIVYFLWFLLNIVAVTILLGLVVKKTLSQ